MKKYILSVVIFSVCTFSFAQVDKDTKKQLRKEAKMQKKKMKHFKGDPDNPITFDKLLIENNDIPYEGEFLFSFEFTNTGVDSLEVTNVKTSCGCTQAKRPEKALAPGESSIIAVTYDTKRVGPFVKNIYVTTNKSEPISLTIKGTVGVKP